MEISRIIGDKPYDMELSDEELYNAFCEQKSEFTLIRIEEYLDNCEQIGIYPPELLRSERFAESVKVQLEKLENNYEENISKAVSAAIEYAIKSETLEDMVTANTADLIINQLNQASLSIDMNAAELSVLLKNEPHTVIRSLEQGKAVSDVSPTQSKALTACISFVRKYTSITQKSRGINELGDYDDLITETEKDKKNNKPLDLTGYSGQGKKV